MKKYYKKATKLFGSRSEYCEKHAEQEKVNYMDKNTPVKEDSSELARELLIAISESLPEKILEPTPVHEDPYTPNGTELTKEAREDKLRSDLISISYSPSPEKIALPAAGPQPTEG